MKHLSGNKILFLGFGALITVTCYAVLVIGLGSYYCWPNTETLYLTGDVKASNVLQAAEKLLLNYDGRYFTNLLHGLNPVAIGWIWGYKLMPIVGTFLFFSSVFFWITSVFKINSLVAAVFSAALTVIHFAVSPEIVTELFNLIGSYVYLYGICFWMIWTGAFWRLINAKGGKRENRWFFISAFGLIASTGCNEEVMLLNAFSLSFLFLFSFLTCREHLPTIVPLLTIGIISVVFFVSCPGWRVRLILENPSINFSLYNKIKVGTEYYLYMLWIFVQKSSFVFLAFLFICLSVKPIQFINPGIKRENKWLVAAVLLFAFLASYLMILAYYLPMDDVGLRYRIFSPAYTLLQLLLCGILLVVLPPPLFLQNSVRLVLILWFAGALLFGKNNYALIIKEYREGQYEILDHKVKERISNLRIMKSENCAWKKVCVEPYGLAQPTAIFYPVKIQPNRGIDSRNTAYERYFGLDEVSFCSDTFSKTKALIELLNE